MEDAATHESEFIARILSTRGDALINPDSVPDGTEYTIEIQSRCRRKADAIVRFDCVVPQDEDDSDVPIAVIARIPPLCTVVLQGFQNSHKRFCFRKLSEGAPASFPRGTLVDHGVI